MQQRSLPFYLEVWQLGPPEKLFFIYYLIHPKEERVAPKG